MRRHDLAYVRPEARFRFHCGVADAGLSRRVSEWIKHGRPLVVARQAAGKGDVLLGLTLPASEGRRRIGCLVPRQDVVRVNGPLAMTRCLPRLGLELAGPLASLASRLAAQGIPIGIYGSLAWEVLSQEVYRHEGSDVDVICDVASLDQTTASLAALTETAAGLACGLDGEIRFPDGRAVAWKELAMAWPDRNSQVLVKGPEEVGLAPLTELLSQFGEEPAHA